MNLVEFLNTVITGEAGWFCLLYAPDDLDSKAKQEWFKWPSEKDKIIERVEELKDKNDVYYSPYLFAERNHSKEHVLPNKTIVADLDEANVLVAPVRPTILVETSEGRHQGYWLLTEYAESIDKHEELSRRMTYAIPRCDRTGWFVGKFVRVPETFNYKYGKPHKIRVVEYVSRYYAPYSLETLPSVNGKAELEGLEDLSWVDDAENIKDTPDTLLEAYRHKLPAKVLATYDIEQEDRSAALFALETALFRAGATREEVYYLAFHSDNNKFRDLKYGGRRELAKDVLRAQQAVASNDTSHIREAILKVRRLQAPNHEKKMYVAEMITEHLSKVGHFIHCEDGSKWYIRDDIGKPVLIERRGEGIGILLDTMYGVNATEAESGYTIESLSALVDTMPQAGSVSYMSYYNSGGKTVLVHTGRKGVLKIGTTNTEEVTDGYAGIVFPWSASTQVIEPYFKAVDKPWYEVLFGDCLDNMTNLSPPQAMAILRSWTIMILLRSSMAARPILALFGQPGSGKSTLFRRIYILFYGRNKALNSVTVADDFDYAVATDPIVVLDNVDTFERWLPDKLALSAAASELTKRKLWTNSDVVVLRRQAFIGITAHNPKFGREDITDRMIILNFERLEHFKPESIILDHIAEKRNELWGGLIKDLQTVLQTPYPNDSEIPQFRIEDFARMGIWICNALGIGDDFKNAISTLRGTQMAFNLEEDHILLEAITRYIEKTDEEKRKEWLTPGRLWTHLEARSSDSVSFVRMYKNSVALGRKLFTMYNTLKMVVDVEWRYNSDKGSREWRFLSATPRTKE